MATKAEQVWMNKVASLGCYVCQRPASLHHIRPIALGMGMRSSHFETIPLCWEHHQGKTGIHMDKKNFQNKYGTEKEILEIVRKRVIEQDKLSSIEF